MPYLIEKKGAKYIVVSEVSGKVKGTHDTKKEATAQQKALYTRASDFKKGINKSSVVIDNEDND